MIKTLQDVVIPLKEGNVRFSDGGGNILLEEIEDEPIHNQKFYGVTAKVWGETYDLGIYNNRRGSSRKFTYVRKGLLNGDILELYGENKARVVVQRT
jgi:hypothetical protein